MPTIKLHIVSFDIPYPADYGGVIDVFYKIKALAACGCEIYLHCFEYGREHAAILKSYCKEVWYYPRLSGYKGLSLKYPYITYSRRNKKLLERLININAPILFEGIHTTYYLKRPELADRIKLVRAHNVEHDYYSKLAQKTISLLSKLYFTTEARLLKNYETSLDDVDVFLTLSKADREYFQRTYSREKVAFIAPFHPFKVENIPTGLGDFCLYHGNLGHPENEEAVTFLLQNVIPQLNHRFIIAGRSPSSRIIKLCHKLQRVELIQNPDEQTMHDLIRNAQINLLPTFQASGMKLKLLYALFKGKHVIANDKMTHGTGLEPICNIANSASQMIDTINKLFYTVFNEDMKNERSSTLKKGYDNLANAQRLITYLQQRSL